MLTIDGSVLEGGGQIVRNAVALSAITGTPIIINSIRAGRKKPGMRPQHIAAVQAVAKICRARYEGLVTGSDRIQFIPGDPVRDSINIDIGTAGSIPLVLQAWLPVALHAGGMLTVSGGTEVVNSPTIDYLYHLHMNFLKQHGATLDLDIQKRGYFPEGGGKVRVNIKKPVELEPLTTEDQRFPVAEIISCSSRLPGHVADRQAESARKNLGTSGSEFRIRKDIRPGPGTGSSLTVVCGWKGSSAIGMRGLPAESVGEIAARGLLDELKKPGAIDTHLADQLLIYLAQYGGCYTATDCSLHARTVCFVLSRFGYHVDVQQANQNSGTVFSS